FEHGETNLAAREIIAGTGDTHYVISTTISQNKVYRLNLTTLNFEQVFLFIGSFEDAAYHPSSGLWVVNSNTNLYNSSDQGDSWQEITTLPGAQFNRIYFGAEERMFLRFTQFEQLFYISNDNGQSWISGLDFIQQTIIGPAVTGLSNGDEFYYHSFCEDYMLLKSTDQSETFEDLLLNFQEVEVRQMTAVDTDRLLAASCNLDLQLTIDDGQSWNSLRSTDGIPLKSTTKALDGSLVGIGSYNQIYRSLDDGDSWENITPAEPIGNLSQQRIAALDMNRILFLTSSGTSYYTEDGGENWTQDQISQSNASLIAHPIGIFISYSNFSNNYHIYDTSDDAWLIRNFDTNIEGRLQAFVTDDERLVFYSSGNSLTVGKILVSEDYGAPFAVYDMLEFTTSSFVQIVSNSANKFFMLTHEALYESSNDGADWVAIEENLPGGNLDNIFLFIDEEDYLYFQASTREVYRTTQPTVFTNFISGHLWADNDLDCMEQNEGEFDLVGWMLTATSDEGIFYSHTNDDGNYLLNAPPGSYEVSVIVSNPLYTACESGIMVDLIPGEAAEMVDFPIQPTTFCSLLRPVVSTPFLRRCFDNTFQVSISNEGNTAAEDATVTVALDDFLVFQNASLPVLAQEGQLYTFDLGTLEAGQLIEFTLTA
ncbi:MAG: YCF48-related protein, partial [Bacteroidota bacterium]